MAHLTLAGLSEDGKRLLLVSDKGVEFTLDVDQRLRAALRGDPVRLGQLEIKMDSTLRPRDIQARIRAGETPESVAQVAQTTVEAIMPFAAPVLAERQHVAQRAQRASVRRSAHSSGARTLGEAVGAHLRGRNVDPSTVDWDAARREDGKWTLTAAFSAESRSGIARFVFDAPGNYCVIDNDDAGWLVGDGPQAETAAAANAPATGEGGNDLARARARRAAAAGSAEDQLPLGDDAISMVSETGEVVDQPAEPGDSAEPTPEPEPVAEDDDAVVDPPAPEEAGPAAEEPPARKPSRKRGRASVPSWDEIMFGSGDSESR